MGKSDLSITGNVHLGNAEVSVLQFLFRKSEERVVVVPAGPLPHDRQQKQQTMEAQVPARRGRGATIVSGVSL